MALRDALRTLRKGKCMGIVRRATVGVTAGVVGTSAMTLVMEGLFRKLPRYQRLAPLPPRTITSRLLHRLGYPLEKHSDQHKFELALLSHFGYGMTCGALYSLLLQSRRFDKLSPAVSGALFGLGVWA